MVLQTYKGSKFIKKKKGLWEINFQIKGNLYDHVSLFFESCFISACGLLNKAHFRLHGNCCFTKCTRPAHMLTTASVLFLKLSWNSLKFFWFYILYNICISFFNVYIEELGWIFYLYFCPKKLHTFIKKVKSSKEFFSPKKFN